MFESVLNAIQLSINNIIVEELHGFRPKCLTTTCNLVFSNYKYVFFQNWSQVNVIYTDFNKALDSCRGLSLASVTRYQYVKVFVRVFGIKSNMFLASFGTQGKHLFPLLFSLFINRLQRFMCLMVFFVLPMILNFTHVYVQLMTV